MHDTVVPDQEFPAGCKSRLIFEIAAVDQNLCSGSGCRVPGSLSFSREVSIRILPADLPGVADNDMCQIIEAARGLLLCAGEKERVRSVTDIGV